MSTRHSPVFCIPEGCFYNECFLIIAFRDRIASLFVPTSTRNRKMHVPGAVEYSGLYSISLDGYPFSIYDRFNPRTSSFPFFPGWRWRSIDHRPRSAISVFRERLVRYIRVYLNDTTSIGRLVEITFRTNSSKVSPDTKCRCANDVQISMYVRRRWIPAYRQVARNDFSPVLSPTGFFIVYVSSNGCLREGLHRFKR